MDLWKSGDFDTLVREVRYIQSKLRSFTNVDTIEQLARKFNDLMLAGKINPALRLLSDSKCSSYKRRDEAAPERQTPSC